MITQYECVLRLSAGPAGVQIPLASAPVLYLHARMGEHSQKRTIQRNLRAPGLSLIACCGTPSFTACHSDVGCRPAQKPQAQQAAPGSEGEETRGGKEARCQGPMNEPGVWMRICHAQGASLASQSVRGDGTLRRKRASSLDWPGSASSHASCRLAGKGSRGNQTLARWDEGSDLGPGLCYSLRSKTIEASRCLARRLDLLDEGPGIVLPS